MSREPSPGELSERLDRFEKALKGLVRTFHDDLEADIRDLKTQLTRMEDKVVWRDTYKADQRATDRRFDSVEGDVDDLEQSQLWMRRVLVANLVLPLLVLVIGAVLVANLPT